MQGGIGAEVLSRIRATVNPGCGVDGGMRFTAFPGTPLAGPPARATLAVLPRRHMHTSSSLFATTVAAAVAAGQNQMPQGDFQATPSTWTMTAFNDPIPASPGLANVVLYAQWGVADPGAANPFGLAMTSGFGFRIR